MNSTSFDLCKNVTYVPVHYQQGMPIVYTYIYDEQAATIRKINAILRNEGPCLCPACQTST